MFHKAKKFNQPIGNWDVSKVTDMRMMFYNATIFNHPIGNWDVSKVTDMSEMFSSLESLDFNQPIGNWDVSKVTRMSSMFCQATKFNQPTGNWDVSKVTDMGGMFFKAEKFNQDISNWDVSNVTRMSFMFFKAEKFNQPIGNWDTSKVIDMSSMFCQATKFNQPIGNWDVSKVNDMRLMFAIAEKFNQDIGNWDVSNVNDMGGMFEGATNFNQDNSKWENNHVSNANDIIWKSKKNEDLNNTFDLNKNVLIASAILLKEMSQVDGDFSIDEREYFSNFINNYGIKNEIENLEEDESSKKEVLEQIKYFNEKEKDFLLNNIIKVAVSDGIIDDTEISNLVELLMQYGFSTLHTKEIYFDITGKNLSFEDLVNRRFEFYKVKVSKADHSKMYKLNLKAKELLLNSEFNQAIDLFNEIVQLVPKNEHGLSGGVGYLIPDGDLLSAVILSDVYNNLGECHYHIKNFDVSILNFENAIKESKGKSYHAFSMIGIIKLNQGDIQQATDYFSEAIALNKNHFNSYYHRALCLSLSSNAKKDLKQALEDIMYYLDAHPDDVAASNLKNVILKAEETDEKGIEINIGSSQVNKDDILNLINEINLLMNIDYKRNAFQGTDADANEAIRKIDLAINLYNPSNPYALGDAKLSLPHLHFMKVQCKLKLGHEVAEIIEELVKVITHSEGNYRPEKDICGSKIYYEVLKHVDLE